MTPLSEVLRPFLRSHHALLALLFFVGLELIFAFQRWLWLAVGILFALLTAGVILLRREESDQFHPTQAILPLLAAAGLTAFALFLPASPLLHWYFIGSGVVFYLLLVFGAKRAYPTWNWGMSLLVLFLDVAAVLGWHFHFAHSFVLTLLVAWIVIWLISWQAMRRIPGATHEGFLLALSLSFGLAQIVWVLQFSPLHFLAQAGLILVLYYVAFHLVTVSFERELTRRDIMEYTSVGVGALIILFSTTRWI